jgi:alkylhydroperoxidase/carboxymuconolactone decarboxylase family protein YurZ/quercetin dioxygenase-like cupin family protein
MASRKVTAGQETLGSFAPKFAQLNDDVLFGEVWSREAQLSPRDRSLITVTSLLTSGIFDSSLSFHLNKARENGVAKEEIAEALTHLAFYSGWPKAWAAFRLAKEIWTEDKIDSKLPSDTIFPIGEPNDAFSQYFVGQSYLKQLTENGVPVFNVTFEPGCRNNWHIHKAAKGGGQILLCTRGRGWYQEWGEKAQELHPGNVVTILSGVKHWHGAAKNNWFSHLALEVPGENTVNEWLEPVDEDEYSKLN